MGRGDDEAGWEEEGAREEGRLGVGEEGRDLSRDEDEELPPEAPLSALLNARRTPPLGFPRRPYSISASPSAAELLVGHSIERTSPRR